MNILYTAIVKTGNLKKKIENVEWIKHTDLKILNTGQIWFENIF